METSGIKEDFSHLHFAHGYPQGSVAILTIRSPKGEARTTEPVSTFNIPLTERILFHQKELSRRISEIREIDSEIWNAVISQILFIVNFLNEGGISLLNCKASAVKSRFFADEFDDCIARIGQGASATDESAYFIRVLKDAGCTAVRPLAA
jgi:hypothetical protein